MRDRLGELGQAVVVVVTFADLDRLSAYRHHLELPFAVLADPQRAVYQAFGLGRGRWWHVYGWRTLRRYFGLLAHGGVMERPTEDTLQLGGDFVVDRDGRLAYGYWGDGPADRPSVTDLVGAVAQA